MSLQGTIESFALPDVLVLLSSTKKTGELKVVGARREGQVWVDKGEIVHTQKDGKDAAPVDTIFELLRLESGTFSFANDAAAPKRGEGQVVDLVLSDAQARLAEWKDIERVVPHLDAVVDMAANAPGDEVTVNSAQWKLLVAVAGGNSVHSLMERLERSEFDTCKAVKELVEARMATIDVDAKPRAGAKAPERAEAAKTEDKKDKSETKPADNDVAAKLDDKASAKADAKDDEASDDAADDGDQLNRARRIRSTTSGGSSESDDKVAPRVAAVKDGDRSGAGASSNGNGNGGAKSERSERSDAEAKEDDTDALVAQLAALGVDEDDPEAKEKIAARLAEQNAEDGEEPINRGLLLKFLSSVRN